jgi:hypothetical protein
MIRCALVATVCLLAPPLAALPDPYEEIETEGDDPDDEAPDAIEVVVEGKISEPAHASLDHHESRHLPGALGDPFRAIEILPGVVPAVSGLPFFFVRGAPPGNMGYFLDGVRVPYLFHVLGGPAVIHPKLIERVDLYQGGYPARYGRYAGAILSATTVEPRSDWHGEGQLRLIDAGGLAEGGFANGRGTVLLAGRYSYTAAIFSLISPDVTLDYRDFQARVSYDVTDRDRLSVFAFGAYDKYLQEDAETQSSNYGAEFYRVDTRYDVRLERGGKLRAAVTTGYDRSSLKYDRTTQDVVVGSRVHLYQPVSRSVALDLGFELQHDRYEFDDPHQVPDRYRELFRGRTEAAASTWLGVDYRPAAGVVVSPGIRVDGFLSDGDKAIGIDPRLRMTVSPFERVRILSALGVAHQPPAYLLPIPGLSPTGLDEGLQTALQASTGVEVDLPWSMTALVSVFDNVFLDMTDVAGSGAAFDQPEVLLRTMGSGKGVELSLRRSLSHRIGGFLSYTLSRTTRSHDNQHYPAAFDRTHVFSAALGFDFGSGWLGGTRFSYYSGTPHFYEVGEVALIEDTVIRDPDLYRLDVRFEKKWLLTDRAWLSLVLEVVNATLQSQVVDSERLVPVTLPSLGLEGGYD